MPGVCCQRPSTSSRTAHFIRRTLRTTSLRGMRRRTRSCLSHRSSCFDGKSVETRRKCNPRRSDEREGRMLAAYHTIRYERNGHIGTLTLARPEKRNAQNPLMWEELAALGRDLLEDESLRCLVVVGEGPVFSAGIDLVEGLSGFVAELAERPREHAALERGFNAATTFTWIPQLGCPSVAAVQGHAYGAGLQ